MIKMKESYLVWRRMVFWSECCWESDPRLSTRSRVELPSLQFWSASSDSMGSTTPTSPDVMTMSPVALSRLSAMSEPSEKVWDWLLMKSCRKEHPLYQPSLKSFWDKISEFNIYLKLYGKTIYVMDRQTGGCRLQAERMDTKTYLGREEGTDVINGVHIAEKADLSVRPPGRDSISNILSSVP